MCGIVRHSLTIATSLCAVALAAGRAFGQVPQGEAACGGWHDDSPVPHRLSTHWNLPPLQKSAYGIAQVVPIPTSARPQLTDGCSAEPARSARTAVLAGGLKQPFGIAFYPPGPHPRWAYIARIPTAYHSDAGEVRADVPSFEPDGSHMHVVATGLRNCDGMAAQPAMGEVCFNGAIWRMTYRGVSRDASGAGVFLQAGLNGVKGRDLYMANCSACHLPNGEGVPGAFPPLKGSGVVNKDDAAKHIQVVLNGMHGARAGGVVYAAAMPPFAGVLSDAEIADIIDYERSSWGNHGMPVTASQVAAERARPR